MEKLAMKFQYSLRKSRFLKPFNKIAISNFWNKSFQTCILPLKESKFYNLKSLFRTNASSSQKCNDSI